MLHLNLFVGFIQMNGDGGTERAAAILHPSSEHVRRGRGGGVLRHRKATSLIVALLRPRSHPTPPLPPPPHPRSPRRRSVSVPAAFACLLHVHPSSTARRRRRLPSPISHKININAEGAREGKGAAATARRVKGGGILGVDLRRHDNFISRWNGAMRCDSHSLRNHAFFMNEEERLTILASNPCMI